ncbi:MAG: DUF1150 family protein [Candidatus Pacebacteria bacterium]|nr:DUF1150 family protein [Candidatus Paceibacterota bacterium]
MLNRLNEQTEMPTNEFQTLGLNIIAFVKPIQVEGETAFGIHAADGTPMAIVSDYELAFAAIRQNDLEPVSVH